jgi:hypothetical protein
VVRGDTFSDLSTHIADFTTAQGYPVEGITQSECASCGGTLFGLVVDATEGCTQRTCRTCSTAVFIADSDEFWDDADPGEAGCPRGSTDFECGIGFSLIDHGEISWITVGGQCAACGVLGVYADWNIDYEPSRLLLTLT